MWPYLVTFFLSCLFAGVADYYYKFGRKRIFAACSFVAILIGSVLAGLRDSSVGTDVLTYGNYVFQNACYQSSIFDFFAVYIDTIEPLYLLLNFIISRVTNDEHWLYFVLQFLTITFVYTGMVDLKKHAKIEIWLGLFVYYTMFYGFSMNGMRQATACCIIFWSMRFIYEKQFWKYFWSVILAAGFHYSVVVFLCLYVIYQWIDKSKNKQLVVLSLVIAFVVAALGFRYIMAVVAIIMPKYSKYLELGATEYSLNPAIVRLPFPLLLMLFYKIYKRKSDKTDFWLVLLIGDIIFAMLRGASTTVYRMSYYFAVVKMGAYPLLCQAFNKKSQLFVKPVLIAVLLIIWYYQVVLQGNDEIYPYASDVWTWLNG